MASEDPSSKQLPWPDQESTTRPGETARQTLDYICWVTEEMLGVGFHAGSRRDEWRRRVHTAYGALFHPVLLGFGDPYPPDVPPAKNPGIWPDVPASGIPGMTLRHQLTVVRMLCNQIRTGEWLHSRAEETREWDQRLARAFGALDHGDAMAIPEEARTEPSPQILAAREAELQARTALAKRRTEQLRQQVARMREKRAAAAAAKKAGKKKASPAAAAKKAAAKKTAKKPPAKKAATKKAAAKKPPAKKAATKKAAAKKTAKKPPAKKAATKKAAAKKPPATKKAAAKKKTAKKKAAKKKTTRR